ncbi:hypothetical protein J437_LFUL005621 [Ladona fulva]|uniref:Centrosomal protein of 19 kDa n=1 Tax=Ladona fulva TaxID=123851 RepID=A0A8K0NZP5_LADFU|nr:hypothetical protein J437_LFUL005621 [Ladona fulva]
MANETSTTIVPLRVGIRFSPPALVYVYEKKSGDIFPADKLRRRIMPIRHFNESSNIENFARELLLRHGKKLCENVPIETVCKMLRLLREHQKGVDLKTALEEIEKEDENDVTNATKNEDNDRRLSINKTFLVESDLKNATISERQDESYDLEVDEWDDEGDDSLEMHFSKTVTKNFIRDLLPE